MARKPRESAVERAADRYIAEIDKGDNHKLDKLVDRYIAEQRKIDALPA